MAVLMALQISASR